MAEAFDVAVIGGGPAGYVFATRAAQLGMRVVCIDKRPTLGGTCLNVGCIPSKALLESSHHFAFAADGLAAHGVAAKPKLDLAAMLGRKDQVVDDLTKGIAFLFRKNKVAHIVGAARLTKLAPGGCEIAVEGQATVSAGRVVIATGSDHIEIPSLKIDEKRVVSSTGALSLPAVPKHLVVVGGGYIGLELGSVWRRLGAAVTVVEMLDRILPGMDSEIAQSARRALEKQGMAFRLGAKVAGAKVTPAGVALTLQEATGASTLAADVVLVAVGRRAYTDGLGLAEAGVATDERGRVVVDRRYATNAKNVYAIGDVIAGPMLAHKGEEEGVALAEILAGQAGHVNYDTVPGVVYTWPEIASVGKSEDELKAAGVAFVVGKFPFSANSRARAAGDSDGLVKLIADAKTDRLLGAHVIGPDAGTIIHELVMAMEFGGSAEDVARAFHAHPTLNEAVKEAALAVAKRAIHI